MPKAVIVDYEKCTGCRICEIACSTKNEGEVSYERSRIKVYTYPPGLDIPIVCAQCLQAPCIEACPQKIISRDSQSVAVRGTGGIHFHNLDEFNRLAREAYKGLPKNYTIRARRRWGTARSVLLASDQDLYPTRNYQEATFEGAEDLSAEVMEKRFWVKHKACFGCSVNCGKLGVIRSGPYKGTVLDGVEYETTAMLGANCGIGNYEAVAHANLLCDKLGLDTISVGNVIAYAMECYERGIFTEKETDGLEPRFGNEKAMIELLRRTTYRNGFGDLLAEGVKRFSEKLGEKAQSFAMHVKGLELPGWGARASPGMGLGYATADRGGCHTRAWPIDYEISGVAPNGSRIGR